MKQKEDFPVLGFGLGLRSKHYSHILEHLPKIDFFEVISENFMDTQGKPKESLLKIREHYPIALHGVSLSIGTIDPINSNYLKSLKELIQWVKPAWISDHLCWTGVAHKNTHDLLPVPYTREALEHIVSRIQQVQEYLGYNIALENPSTYLEFKEADMSESEFMKEMVSRSGCNLLLDVNNIYVSCYNHHLDPQNYIDNLPLDKVAQIHLAGHLNKGTHIIDTHDDYVCDEVWNLYKYCLSKMHYIPNTMIEWDGKIPEFSALEGELEKAKEMARNCHHYELPYIVVKNSYAVPSETLSLNQVQTQMQETILNNQTELSAFHNFILEKDNFSSRDQLNVYVNGYHYRLYDVTAEDYPTLKSYLGTEKFEKLVDSFIKNTDSENFSLVYYSNLLSSYIKSFYPQDEIAFEIAKLEALVAKTLHLPQGESLKQEDLTGITPENFLEIILYPRPSLTLTSFNYDVNSYYSSLMNEEALTEITKEEIYLAIFRHEGAVWRMTFEKKEYELLQKLFSGESLEVALSECNDAVADQIFHWFSRWKHNGLLESVNYYEHISRNKVCNAVA